MSLSYNEHILELEGMKKYPASLFYLGNTELLDRPKVSIVGSRSPSLYTQNLTFTLANTLAKRGVAVVSGAAMGVDAIAHKGAGAANTIAVAANGLDIRYPGLNRELIAKIEKEGLVLSQFNDGFHPTGWSFVIRNELVVALGEILIVTQADLDSGSMRSVEYAQRMGKEIYVFPQRLDESQGTNALLQEGKAQAIYDIESFASRYGTMPTQSLPKDEFFYFCQSSPDFDDVVEKFGTRVYEAELEGLVKIDNGKVMLL
jgi:DNA processing protein